MELTAQTKAKFGAFTDKLTGKMPRLKDKRGLNDTQVDRIGKKLYTLLTWGNKDRTLFRMGEKVCIIWHDYWLSESALD